MEAILQWLQDDVGVGPLGSNIEKDCANGTLFGKILNHYGLQTDASKLLNKSTPDAKLANFQRLEPIFRSLDLKFNSHVANQLMTEERGVALRMLQQLKVTLDAAKAGPVTPRSTSLLLKTNRLAHKQTFRTMEEQTFDTMLRLKTGNPKDYRMQNHLRSFEEEAIHQQRIAEQLDALDRMNKEQYLSDMRMMHLSKMSENKAYLQDWERQGRINHAKNQTTQKERERRELRLDTSLKEKTRRRELEHSHRASDDVVKGIQSFEESLKRIQGPEEEAGIDEAAMAQGSKQTPLQFLETLSSRLPSGAALAAQGQAYMTMVQERRGDEMAARRERDRRRRRIIVHEQAGQRESESEAAARLLISKLHRQLFTPAGGPRLIATCLLQMMTYARPHNLLAMQCLVYSCRCKFLVS